MVSCLVKKSEIFFPTFVKTKLPWLARIEFLTCFLHSLFVTLSKYVNILSKMTPISRKWEGCVHYKHVFINLAVISNSLRIMTSWLPCTDIMLYPCSANFADTCLLHILTFVTIGTLLDQAGINKQITIIYLKWPSKHDSEETNIGNDKRNEFLCIYCTPQMCIAKFLYREGAHTFRILCDVLDFRNSY